MAVNKGLAMPQLAPVPLEGNVVLPELIQHEHVPFVLDAAKGALENTFS